MLNEFVYCPRLFYYEHVEGVFVESADTVRGATVHARVDKGKGALPKAKKTAGEGGGEEATAVATAEAEEIHSRSVMLGSERLGVVAKMDLVEATLDDAAVWRRCARWITRSGRRARERMVMRCGTRTGCNSGCNA